MDEGKAVEILRDVDDLELPEHRGKLAERVLFGFMAAAAVPGIAFALFEMTGVWVSLLLLLAAPYFFRKSRDAKRELKKLDQGEL